MTHRLIALIASLALVITACGTSGGESTAAAAESLGASSEGIQVHGHWTIDVVNPDGTLDSHTEFENDFFGAIPLGRLLAGDATIGNWEVDLANTNGPSPCSTTGILCLILSVVAEPTLTGLSLSGSVVADQDGSVDRVRTITNLCASSVSPDGCGTTPGGFLITQKFLDPADVVAVSASQTIEVIVDISFSS